MSSGPNISTIMMICKTLNHQWRKIKNESEEKKQKGKVLLAYGNQFKGWCNKCGKFWHKSTGPKCKRTWKIQKKRKSSLDFLNCKKYWDMSLIKEGIGWRKRQHWPTYKHSRWQQAGTGGEEKKFLLLTTQEKFILCIIEGESFFMLTNMHGLAISEFHVTLLMATEECMTSPSLTIQCKVSWALWKPWKWVSFIYMWDRSMGANCCTLYGL